MAVAAKHRASHLGLERDLVMFAAMIADDLKALWRVFTLRGLFRSALWAPLRRHQVPLVKDLLLLFGE